MKETKIVIPDDKQVEWKEVNGVITLVLVDEQDNRHVTERIKTFDDACQELGRMSENGDEVGKCLIKDWNNLTSESIDLIAYLKLRIIAYALNEGWTPQFTPDECRYYPWFTLYTQAEIDAMDDEERCRVVGRASVNAFAYGGLVYSGANNVSTFSSAVSGSRLAFRDRERAEYAGKQFAELWADFYFNNKLTDKTL